MIISDLNIICINQKRKHEYLSYNYDLDIKAIDRNIDSSPVYFYGNFETAYKLNGWWYTLWPAGDGMLDNAFFDFGLNTDFLKIEKNWQDEIYKILSFYISSSPIHKIGVIVWLDGNIKDIVHNPISLDCFAEGLRQGNLIKYDELYYVVA